MLNHCIFKGVQLLKIQNNQIKNVTYDKVIDGLYYQKYKIPDNLTPKQIKELKEKISRINYHIPLYDPYSDNLYLITQEDLYNCIFKLSYRFPTVKFINQLKSKIKKNEELLQSIKNIKKHQKIIIEETIYRYNLMIEFLNNFDNGILLDTYIKTLYNTNELGRSITLCQKPSFSPMLNYIKPYFTKDEIIYMALNMGFIQKYELNNLTNENIRELCSKISLNDINSNNIIKHHLHIVKNNCVGLIQYFSLSGFMLMNYYLRNNNVNNEYLNTMIKTLIKLCITSPLLDKKYYVYRFIDNDDFLSELKNGDIFQEKGFLSTTRDPFYKQDNETFGWILMKIHIPENKHILCIESISNFPSEQEIILPPNTKLKLINKYNYNFNSLYHQNKTVQNKIKAVYEFELYEVGTLTDFEKNIKKKKKENKENIIIDFLKLKSNNKIKSIDEKINTFVDNYTNDYNQFNVRLNNIIFTITCESYDSIDIYEKFYARTTDNGYIFYCIHDNHQLFTIEFFNDSIIVNYGLKYINQQKSYISDNEFLKFIALISYYFGIKNVIIYCNYTSCNYYLNSDMNDENLLELKFNRIGGYYCIDIHNYIKNKIKRFDNLPFNIIKPEFSYIILNELNNIPIKRILNKINRHLIINQVYRKVYKIDNKNKRNLKDFYLWIIDNYCYFINDFIQLLNTLPEFEVNPFNNDYYTFYPYAYLYHMNIIKSIPKEKELKTSIKNKRYLFNKNEDQRLLLSNRRKNRNKK